jgi:hypothetical protein
LYIVCLTNNAWEPNISEVCHFAASFLSALNPMSLDRCIGLSNDQIDRVHQGALNTYDFNVDTTTISPFEAARLILKYIDDHPVPKAFLSLEKQE